MAVMESVAHECSMRKLSIYSYGVHSGLRCLRGRRCGDGVWLTSISMSTLLVPAASVTYTVTPTSHTLNALQRNRSAPTPNGMRGPETAEMMVSDVASEGRRPCKSPEPHHKA